MKPMFDSYIAAAGMSAPEPEPPRRDNWLPSEPARLNLDAANVTSVLWATGYRLDFSILDIPVLDEWDYPGTTAASPNTRACTPSGCRG